MSQMFSTITETVKITGLSEYFVRAGCRDGSIPCIRSGVKYLVHLPAFLAQLDQEAKKGGAPHA